MLHNKLPFRNYDYIPKLSSYGQGQGHRNKRLPKNVYFFIFKVIRLQFVVILSLHLVFINIIKCSLNTNTFLLQKCLHGQGQGHLNSKSFGPLMKIW